MGQARGGGEGEMSIVGYVGIALVVTFLGLVALNTGTTYREGSYRRGVGWYADMTTPRETLVGRPAVPGPRTVAGWKIRVWLVGGLGFLLGAIAALPLGEPALAGLMAFFGLGLAGLAWDGRRRNERAERENEGRSER
jgi:hypothetical protein